MQVVRLKIYNTSKWNIGRAIRGRPVAHRLVTELMWLASWLSLTDAIAEQLPTVLQKVQNDIPK